MEVIVVLGMPHGSINAKYFMSVFTLRANPWKVIQFLTAAPIDAIFFVPTHTPVLPLPSTRPALMPNSSSAPYQCLLNVPQELVYVSFPCVQVQDWVSDELPWTMIGPLTSPLNPNDRNSVNLRRNLSGNRLANREDVGMFHQYQRVRDFIAGSKADEPSLQFPDLIVVPSTEIEKIPCHRFHTMQTECLVLKSSSYYSKATLFESDREHANERLREEIASS